MDIVELKKVFGATSNGALGNFELLTYLELKISSYGIKVKDSKYLYYTIKRNILSRQIKSLVFHG